MEEHQRVFKLASIFLSYPEQEWLETEELYSEIMQIENTLVQLLFKQFFHYLRSKPIFEIAENYAMTFDFNAKSTLYLTYPVLGDHPERGKGLVRLKQEFLAAGCPLESDELPDYLPLILEFCSLVQLPAVQKIWSIHKKAIESLLKELTICDSPYQLVVQACIETLDHLNSKQPVSQGGP